MTCIVGLVDGDQVYIGGDSQGSTSAVHAARMDPKVFRIEDMLFGFSSSYRGGQVVQYWFNKPKHPREESVDVYMHRRVIPEIRKIMHEHGTQFKKDDIEQSMSVFLIGYRGRLFRIDSDYQIGEHFDGYCATGSGQEVALGSLYSSAGQPSRQRVFQALSAAEHHARGVGGPFKIEAV